MKAAERGHAPVKLSYSTYEQARALLAQVSRHGWASIGVDRDDPPSLGSVIEEAMKLLSSRARPRKERK